MSGPLFLLFQAGFGLYVEFASAAETAEKFPVTVRGPAMPTLAAKVSSNISASPSLTLNVSARGNLLIFHGIYCFAQHLQRRLVVLLHDDEETIAS